MADKTGKYRTQYESIPYYNYLVRLRQEANLLLTEWEREQDLEKQSEFKDVMKLLIREMEPKYQRRKDIDKPEILQNWQDSETLDLNVKELRKVLYSIRDLQEKLGIVSKARQEYAVEEMGEVSAEK